MDDRDKLLRQFAAAIPRADLTDPQRLAANLMLFGDDRFPMIVERPELRRPRRDNVVLYRIRVDLDDAKPPIWRRLDVRSDVPLDVVHQILQAVFEWDDYHLHRFALGGNPFDPHSQLFLCPFDVEEGDPEDGGIAAADVRLDETLQDPGDVLRYVYDYGDSWELTLRLEAVLPADDGSPSAVVVDGRRAAPPEDCGGIVDAVSLAEVLDDPAEFDLEDLNDALRGPYFMLRESGVDQRLVELVNRLSYTDMGADLTARMHTLIGQPTEPTPEDLEQGLRAFRWFLDRAEAGGIPLTSAGYLKPADVEAASQVVPAMGDWIGMNNRESNAIPLLEFRKSLRSLGLLRKYKGSLLLTKAGAAAHRDPRRLWDFLVGKLPEAGDKAESEATLLLLAYAATSADKAIPLNQVVTALGHLGWRHDDGSPLETYDLNWLPALDVLTNVSAPPRQSGGRHEISSAAATLARAALRRPPIAAG